MSDAFEYTSLITSAHNQKPNFSAMVELTVQPSVDLQNVYAGFPDLFDAQQAVGDQLDEIGTWVGISRNLTTSIGGVTTLPDAAYRILLLAEIASNYWDGTVPGAYSIWNIVFALSGFTIIIQDNQDMTMLIIFITEAVDPLILGLLTNGYIALRPAGVRIAGYFEPDDITLPIFGWDAENSLISGWDVGHWMIQIA